MNFLKKLLTHTYEIKIVENNKLCWRAGWVENKDFYLGQFIEAVFIIIIAYFIIKILFIIF